ncbi:ubiquinol oxidase, mitochondrial-like [Capsicum annuum]|nr:ubiquinol oxidase, mitochondrial-like [Capsicum annuum]
MELPMVKEDIPPDDEGWLCPGYDCKVDYIDLLNNLQGKDLSIADSWEKLDDISGLPSDDSENGLPDIPCPNEVSAKHLGEEISSLENDLIKALPEEAENERMHLMTMVELVQPKWYERLLVIAVQGAFFNFYFVLYLLFPKLAHRVVGHLEEEDIHSYTLYLNDIDHGEIENVPAPAIAIDYWRMPKDATLKDVDKAYHRDVNHFASPWEIYQADLCPRNSLIRLLIGQ